MNAAQFHLLVNHIPLFALAFAALALIAGLIWKARPLLGFAAVLLVVAGIGGLLANTSGEEAEHLIEGMAGVEEQYLEQHEEMAEAINLPLIAGAVLGLVLIFMVWKNTKGLRATAGVCAAYAVAMSVWVSIVAHSGGEIRHPEIRTGTAAPGNANRGEPQPQTGDAAQEAQDED